MDPVQLLAIFAENKTGQLARVTGLLARANLNIRWVTIASGDSFGVIKLLVTDCQLAYQQLKHSGLPVSLVDVLAIEVADKPGGLYDVALCLAENHINLDNASGFVSNDRAVLLIEVRDLTQAAAILQKQGWRLLSQQQMLNL
jgi:hypothetical protein